MENKSPAQLQVLAVNTSYTKALITHNTTDDYDAVGIVVYSIVGGGSETYTTTPIIGGRTYFKLDPVAASTVITIGHYDAMSDTPALLENKVGINTSASTPLTLKVPPVVVGVTVSSETVEVGTIPAEFIVSMSGEATDVIIEIKKTTDVSWITKYNGPFQSDINLGTVGEAEYNVRVRGRITLPDNSVEQASAYNTWGSTIDVTSSTNPPAQVTGLAYTAMKKRTPTDTYDLKVDWSWVRGSGGGVKAFLVEWKSSGVVWKSASSTSTSIVVPDVPYDLLHDIKITSIPYGATSTSTVVGTFKINEVSGSRVPLGMVFADFSEETDIQVGYRYLRTFSLIDAVRTKTFEIDAATGSINIGAATAEYGGVSPITLNGDTGVFAINGSVITDKIHAATYEMNWIDGAASQPQFRTANKLNYADTSEGIWMGYRATNDFAINIGGADSYIKFADGKVSISANIEIFGNGVLGSYYETRYIASDTLPATPTTRLPPGWTIDVPTKTASQSIYQITAKINADETLNYTWTAPSSLPSGADGTSSYFHLAYADNEFGNGFSKDPTGKAWIGTYVDDDPVDAYSADLLWNWQLVVGPSGTTNYLHIAYATSSDGVTGFSTSDGTTKTYIGQYVDTNPTDSTDPAQYTWSLFKGDPGTSSYFHLAYADNEFGNGFSKDAFGKAWIGTYVDDDPVDATSSDLLWNWQLVVGADGATNYLHIAYATSSDGVTGFSTSDGTTKTYIGQYVDTNPTDSTNPAQYTWSLFKGDQGDQGAPGAGLFTLVNVANTTITTPNSIYKGVTGTTWASSAKSLESYTGGVFVSAIQPVPTVSLMFGLTSTDGNSSSYTNLDYAVYTYQGTFVIYEKGIRIGDTHGSPLQATDVLSVISDGSKVYYKQNGITVYTSEAVPTGTTYRFMCSFSAVESNLNNISFGPSGITGSSAFTLADSANTAVTPTSVTKISGGNNNWNGGGYSLESYEGPSFVSCNMLNTTERLMMGLSKDNGSSSTYSTIDYAIYLTSSNVAQIYEKGVAIPGDKATGLVASDVFMVRNTGSVVKYYVNGTEIYESLAIPTGSYRFDCSFAGEGDSCNNISMGPTGADGSTSYLHIAYANSSDGVNGFSVTDSTDKIYIGQYTDFEIADSNTPATYSWTKIKGDAGYSNLLRTDSWVVGSTGSQGGFTMNGAASENEIVLDTGPLGTSEPIWHASGSGNDPDGGWNAYIPVDHTKSYRSSVWVKHTSNSATTYLGCANGPVSAPLMKYTSSGTLENNPYFWSGDLPQNNKWYLMVGVIHGSGYTGPVTGISGVYDPVTGDKVISGSDFTSLTNVSNQMQRTYRYYGESPSSHYFARPRFEEINGEEYSLEEIIGRKAIDGAPGTNGAGFFRWAIAGFTSWSLTHADTAMTNIRGGVSSATAVEGDVLTLYNSITETVAETRSWNGSSWVTAALLLHGDMIVDGTIIAEKLIADNATFSSAGINVIYNTGGNSGNYTMKVDLLNGEIHIK